MFVITLLITLLIAFVTYSIVAKESLIYDLRFFANLFVPMGIGILSVLFVFFNVCKLPILAISLLELLVAIGLIYKLKIYKSENLRLISEGNEFLGFNKLLQHPILLLFLVIYIYALFLDASIFLFDTIEQPHGQWDAWNYWNMKAKFISKAPYEWPSLFRQMSSEEYHVDYPLLQTGYIALCWLALKSDTVWVPAVFCFLFTFCTIGLLSYSVKKFSNSINGLIAGLIMLSTPFYMFMGDSQYADNTVGYFYLATIVLLTIARTSINQGNILFVFAGITAGLAGWSKNEGLLFMLCLIVAQFTLVFKRGFRAVLNEVKYMIYGMLPTLLLILYYKTFIAAPNDIVNAQGQGTLLKLTDSSRYSMILKWFAEVATNFGKWSTIKLGAFEFTLNPWWFLLIGVLYKGVDMKKYFSSVVPHLTLILLMLVGFFFIYVITPLDLTFHLSTSLHRLYFQLFPSLLFVYFLLLKKTDTLK